MRKASWGRFLFSVYFAQCIFVSPKTKKEQDNMSSLESHHLDEEPEVFQSSFILWARNWV